jgi:ATP-GRASP peptide maturase of grasp-with-spasm system
MVLIISSDTDFSTNDVIDWLNFYDVPYKRYSDQHELTVKALEFNEKAIHFIFEIGGEVYDFNDIKSIWYRRSELRLKTPKYSCTSDIEFDKSIHAQMREEAMITHRLIWDLFKSKSINIEYDNLISKLNVLKSCSELDIKYPKSLITTSKEKLKEFKSNAGQIITKNINQGCRLNLEDTTFMPFTTEITNKDIEALPEEFAPMFFQEMIIKSFELRIFYLMGQFYSSAIFSQNDSKTKVDFRNYNYDNPNRTPPFQLDVEYEAQLERLMSKIDLNSGSIDVLVDEKGDYYFLEVNPIGQFSQVSYPCNYFLERTFAKQLMS